jgi:hypothetical protein
MQVSVPKAGALQMSTKAQNNDFIKNDSNDFH